MRTSLNLRVNKPFIKDIVQEDDVYMLTHAIFDGVRYKVEKNLKDKKVPKKTILDLDSVKV